MHDAEEQARTMTGQDAGIDEITRMHEQVAEMVNFLLFLLFLKCLNFTKITWICFFNILEFCLNGCVVGATGGKGDRSLSPCV